MPWSSPCNATKTRSERAIFFSWPQSPLNEDVLDSCDQLITVKFEEWTDTLNPKALTVWARDAPKVMI
jgi:hypothetical protein